MRELQLNFSSNKADRFFRYCWSCLFGGVLCQFCLRIEFTCFCEYVFVWHIHTYWFVTSSSIIIQLKSRLPSSCTNFKEQPLRWELTTIIVVITFCWSGYKLRLEFAEMGVVCCWTRSELCESCLSFVV